MKTYIILLRGINVGGHKKILMTELKQLISDLGFKNVKTYIQTGNIIVNADLSISKIKTAISKAIEEKYGFHVPVLVIKPDTLRGIIDAYPLNKEKQEKSYFTLLYNKPQQEVIDTLNATSDDYENEEFVITEACIYFYCATGYGRTKLNNNFFEKKLGVTGTARNYKTMMKLLSLSEE